VLNLGEEMGPIDFWPNDVRPIEQHALKRQTNCESLVVKGLSNI
jgi:hypothetical protein